MRLLAPARGAQGRSMFLIRGGVPHSPRRQPNSIGLVVEHKFRAPNTPDAVRWYCDACSEKHGKPVQVRSVSVSAVPDWKQLRQVDFIVRPR